MKRNSGVIGALRSVTQSIAGGVYDLFDAYNWRKDLKWPLSFRYVSLSINSGTILENTSQTITLTTAGFESNTTLYWTILHGTTTSSDFTSSVVSGSFTQSGTTNLGSFSVNTRLIGNLSKPSRTFQIQIRTDSVVGTVVYTSGTYTIPAITASVSSSVSSINEGQSFNLQISVGNMGSYLSWNASLSYSGTASSSDFASGFPATTTISGTGSYSVTYSANNDLTTEGNETVNITVSFEGNTWGSTGNVTINDTSMTPTASTSLSANPIDEGQVMTVTVTTTNFPSGTLYWSLENVSNWEANDQSATSGSFSVSGSSGSFNFTIIADGYTEGTEQFLIRIRLNSTSGTIIGTSATVSINDTSTGTAEPVSLDSFFNGMCSYLAGFMSEFRNPSFYSYTLDGDATFISDGGGDMYDAGNYTNPWFLSGSDLSTNTGNPGQALSYAVTSPTTTDTSFVYRSLGYSTAQLPLTMLGYRNVSNAVVGFQKSGNSGADGGGTLASSLFYNGVSLNTFTVYAFNRQTYNAGDPSHCDLYMLIGHSNWGSSFGTITSFAHPVASGGNGGRLHTSTGSTNVIAVTMLLSKSGGTLVTDADCQTVVTNFTSRMKTYLGY